MTLQEDLVVEPWMMLPHQMWLAQVQELGPPWPGRLDALGAI